MKNKKRETERGIAWLLAGGIRRRIEDERKTEI